MNELKPVFIGIYNGYADHNNLMNFKTYLEFFKEFDLFPDLINQSQLKSLFLSLSVKLIKSCQLKKRSCINFY